MTTPIDPLIRISIPLLPKPKDLIVIGRSRARVVELRHGAKRLAKEE
jgi:hypothetical protein